MTELKERDFQEKCKEIVSREVYINQNFLIEKLLKKGIINIEEIDNYYIDNSEKLEELENELEELENELEELENKSEEELKKINKKIEELKTSKEELEEEQEIPQEILEWWAVSEWFAQKLEKQNEPIINNEYGIWWGRTISGQSIFMDFVIRKIVLNILRIK